MNLIFMLSSLHKWSDLKETRFHKYIPEFLVYDVPRIYVVEDIFMRTSLPLLLIHLAGKPRGAGWD
jgi:hypothetical protein